VKNVLRIHMRAGEASISVRDGESGQLVFLKQIQCFEHDAEMADHDVRLMYLRI
jgi:hypothetical protein